MELKKNPKADLESKKEIFLLIGLIIALSGTILAMEWKSYEKQESDASEEEVKDVVWDEIPVVERQKEEKKEEKKDKPPPPQDPEEIELKENDEILKDTFNFVSKNDLEQNLEIPEEDDSDSIHVNLSVMPLHPKCDKKYVNKKYFKKKHKKKFKEENGEEMTYQDACNECTKMEIWRQISTTVKYPPKSKANGIEGRVTVKVVIETDGKVGEVEILRGLDKYIDEAVIKAVKKLPIFKPGRQQLKPVRVGYNLPITFSIN